MNICRIHRVLSMTPAINDLFILFKMSYRHSSNYFLLARGAAVKHPSLLCLSLTYLGLMNVALSNLFLF